METGFFRRLAYLGVNKMTWAGERGAWKVGRFFSGSFSGFRRKARRAQALAATAIICLPRLGGIEKIL